MNRHFSFFILFICSVLSFDLAVAQSKTSNDTFEALANLEISKEEVQKNFANRDAIIKRLLERVDFKMTEEMLLSSVHKSFREQGVKKPNVIFDEKMAQESAIQINSSVKQTLYTEALSFVEGAQVSDVLKINQIAESQSVIDFFKKPPYEIDVSNFNVFIGRIPTDSDIHAFACFNPVLFSSKLGCSVASNNYKFAMSIASESVKAFIPKVSKQVFKTRHLLVLDKDFYESTEPQAIAATLVQEIRHLYDFVVNPKLFSAEFEQKEFEKLMVIYDEEFLPYIEHQARKLMDTPEYKKWVNKAPFELREDCDLLFLEYVRRLSKAEFPYIYSKVEQNGYGAEIAYLKSLGLSLEEVEAVFKKSKASAELDDGIKEFFDPFTIPPFVGKGELLPLMKLYISQLYNP